MFLKRFRECFSATWPEQVRRLAESYMKNPMQVFVGSLDLAVSNKERESVDSN